MKEKGKATGCLISTYYLNFYYPTTVKSQKVLLLPLSGENTVKGGGEVLLIPLMCSSMSVLSHKKRNRGMTIPNCLELTGFRGNRGKRNRSSSDGHAACPLHVHQRVILLKKGMPPTANVAYPLFSPTQNAPNQLMLPCTNYPNSQKNLQHPTTSLSLQSSIYRISQRT